MNVTVNDNDKVFISMRPRKSFEFFGSNLLPIKHDTKDVSVTRQIDKNSAYKAKFTLDYIRIV